MGTDEPVRISILARADCDGRGMAMTVVRRVLEETGVPARVEVVDVETLDQAEELGFLGSPTVRVGGRDVELRDEDDREVSLGDRIYRTERGLCCWPDPDWIRNAVLLAVARTTTNGTHESSATSSTTSP